MNYSLLRRLSAGAVCAALLATMTACGGGSSAPAGGMPYYKSFSLGQKKTQQFGGGTKLGRLTYAEGDRVRHVKFGEGLVKQIVSGGRDYEVTVDFDDFGTKKMFASFAKLQKL